MSNYIKTDINTIGVDEVGRGTLFGSVVASAVILPETFNDDIYLQIKDSKKLSFKKRSILADYIKTNAIAYGIGVIIPEEIDKINILQASVKAMHIAIDEVLKKLENKKIKANKIIVDGNYFIPILPLHEDDEPIAFECVPKADSIYLNVAAASIVAKDYHDKEILKLLEEDKDLEKWDLRNNMGYATVKHRKAIQQYGLHKLHRKTFKTCANYLNEL
jgi:ribonuclease HII